MSLALDVARAALMEVGAMPERVWPNHADGGRLEVAMGDEVARRATLLGRMAEDGPEGLVRCAWCAPRWTTTRPCTPVRDVLRGVTCGRTS